MKINLDREIEFASFYHREQKRKQGTPYINHPIRVMEILRNFNFSREYLVTALFHDLLEDTVAREEEILLISNKNIVKNVKLLTKSKGQTIEEYLKAIKQNPVTKLVKLSDRYANLEELLLSRDINFIRRYYNESLEYYLPMSKGTVFEKTVLEELKKIKRSSLG